MGDVNEMADVMGNVVIIVNIVRGRTEAHRHGRFMYSLEDMKSKLQWPTTALECWKRERRKVFLTLLSKERSSLLPSEAGRRKVFQHLLSKERISLHPLERGSWTEESVSNTFCLSREVLYCLQNEESANTRYCQELSWSFSTSICNVSSRMSPRWRDIFMYSTTNCSHSVPVSERIMLPTFLVLNCCQERAPVTFSSFGKVTEIIFCRVWREVLAIFCFYY